MEISENIYKIPGNSNIYLILGEKNILIDTSDRVDSVYIKKEIEKIIPLDKIDIVLLTHLHYDHAGNIELFPNAKFYASSDEIENYKNSPEDFMFYDISQETDNILRNQLLPLPDNIFGLKVLKCPGHTRGSVSFLDEENKILFSGDTIFENGIGRYDFRNSVPEEIKNSTIRLRKLALEKNLKICSGHDY